MERLTATCEEWHAIIEALASLSHPSIRQSVQDGIAERLAEHPCSEPHASVTLELDDAGAVAVHRARHQASGDARRSDEANSAIAAAESIIREHQQRR